MDEEAGTITFLTSFIGLPEMIQTANGPVLLRDAGILTFADTFDLETGDFISSEIVVNKGPHPEADSDFTLFCEVITGALGSPSADEHGCGRRGASGFWRRWSSQVRPKGVPLVDYAFPGVDGDMSNPPTGGFNAAKTLGHARVSCRRRRYSTIRRPWLRCSAFQTAT